MSGQDRYEHTVYLIRVHYQHESFDYCVTSDVAVTRDGPPGIGRQLRRDRSAGELAINAWGSRGSPHYAMLGPHILAPRRATVDLRPLSSVERWPKSGDPD